MYIITSDRYEGLLVYCEGRIFRRNVSLHAKVYIETQLPYLVHNLGKKLLILKGWEHLGRKQGTFKFV